ncbi:MAG: CoA transferase [Chloroflexi bacterium]|nr:CoA transferase [Chloroflexota bacterium]
MTSETQNMDLLSGLHVVELGPGPGGAICGQSFVEAGAHVVRQMSSAESDHLWLTSNDGKRRTAGRAETTEALQSADLVVVDVSPDGASMAQVLIDRAHDTNPGAVVVCITPFGLTGPAAEFRGGDLVSFHASGMGRLLTGQVKDLESEPPVRAAGEQSAFISGITAACAGMLALLGNPGGGQSGNGVRGTSRRGPLIDVSTREALACMAIRELAAPAYGRPSQSRSRVGDGGGSTVAIIPASDGFVAISPREERQWEAWLGVMGDPDWGADGRFATKSDRANNWDALHPLIGDWSRTRPKQEIYEEGQAAHVPCFPLATPGDLLSSRQLLHRGFFKKFEHPDAGPIFRPGAPYRVHRSPGENRGANVIPTSKSTPVANGPLSGFRVLDLSWVIAGPTCTRYLAALGAEVIKVETAGRPDPGRASELHAVLGQSKLGLSLDLKRPEALEVAHRLVERCDVVVENFATGVLERLGLGYETLRQISGDIVLLSASGLGRTGPDAGRVAYGTLIQCYTGFAALNGYPGAPPRVGWAWADPLCGLRMAFAIGAALRDRARTGRGAHIDFSMVEAVLATMPGPLVQHQLTGEAPGPMGNDDPLISPHGVFPCKGDDEWIALAAGTDAEWTALCGVVPGLTGRESAGVSERRNDRAAIDAAITAWTSGGSGGDATSTLQRSGVPAYGSPDSTEMFEDLHLRERGFYRSVTDADGAIRPLPGLPWRWPDGERREPRPAPSLGGDTDTVLMELLGMSSVEIAALRDSGALT